MFLIKKNAAYYSVEGRKLKKLDGIQTTFNFEKINLLKNEKKLKFSTFPIPC